MVTAIKINGTVAPGFETIKTLFEKEMYEKAEDKVQLCIYHKSEKVVDLWACVNNDESFTPDSLTTIFSSGKSLESLGIAHLKDKGLLSYDDKIADHWPEFGKLGKENITVADLMRHEAGLQALGKTLMPEDLLPENLSNNNIGYVIENQPVKIANNPKYRRKYHAQSRGWVVNELFRRVEPNGRTLGQYLREDIAIPLDADAYVGLKEGELPRHQRLTTPKLTTHLLEGFKPAKYRKKVAYSMFDVVVMFFDIIRYQFKVKQLNKVKKQNTETIHSETTNTGSPNKKKSSLRKKLQIGTVPMKGMNENRTTMLKFFDKPVVIMGESSSFAANCSARGLAKIAAMMAAGGSFEGKEYFSKPACDALHAHPKLATMMVGDGPSFTQGGVNLFSMEGKARNRTNKRSEEGREGFYGWMGLGGSIFQWNIEQQLGFGFVPNCLHPIDLFNERGKLYQAEALRCVANLAS